MVKALALSALLALSACTTASGSFCQIAKPIRLSESAIAAMSDDEVREALQHNLKGQKLCAWKP